MCDEVEMVQKDELENVPRFAHQLTEQTMRGISGALRLVLDLDGH